MGGSKKVENNKWTKEFIQLYKANPCLWDPAHRRSKCRAATINILVKKMKEIDSNANEKSVAKKLSNLRSSYGRELSKVRKDPNYRSSLWFYPYMSFLEAAIKPKDAFDDKRSSSSDSSKDVEEPNASIQLLIDEALSSTPKSSLRRRPSTIRTISPEMKTKLTTAATSPPNNTQNQSTEAKLSTTTQPSTLPVILANELITGPSTSTQQQPLYTVSQQPVTTIRNEDFVYGQSVANFMRELSHSQRYKVKAKIDALLYQAEKENLTK